MKKFFFYYSILLLSCIALVACRNTTPKTNGQEPSSTYITSTDYSRSVAQILDKGPKYNSFLKLANMAGFYNEMMQLNDIMIFVPTDEAFGPTKNKINELSTPDRLERLNEILRYHIVSADFDVENLINNIKIQAEPLRLKTLHGGYIAFTLDGENLKILDENTNLIMVGTSSVRGSNGIVFTIDKILMPREEVQLSTSALPIENGSQQL